MALLEKCIVNIGAPVVWSLFMLFIGIKAERAFHRFRSAHTKKAGKPNPVIYPIDYHI